MADPRLGANAYGSTYKKSIGYRLNVSGMVQRDRDILEKHVDHGLGCEENQKGSVSPTELSFSSNKKVQQQRADDSQEGMTEGGIQGWSTVVGALLIQFCGFGYSNTFGVYQDYYTRIYLTDSSPSAISWIGSVNSFIVVASGLYVGALYDRGYFYYLLYGGSLIMSFSLFMLSLAKPDHLYQNFLAQAIGHGIGAGMMNIPSVVVLSLYFSKRRAQAMTVVASGSSLGALVHPIMLNNLIHTKLGFGGATRISAGLITLVLFIACCLIRPQIPPPRPTVSMGRAFFNFYYKDWPYAAVSAGLLFFTTGFYFPLYYLQIDAVKHGLSQNFSFYAIVIMNGSSLIGRLLPGFFIHSAGVVNMVVASAASASAVILGMIALDSIPSFILVAVLYGFNAGAFVTLQGPLIVSLTPDESDLGTRLGVAYFFCAIGALIGIVANRLINWFKTDHFKGPPIQGALLSNDFVWWRPALFSGISALVGTLCFVSLYFSLKSAAGLTIYSRESE